MSKFLVHKDFSGKPIGVWAESGQSYYPDESVPLVKSGKRVVAQRFAGEPWDEFTDRLGSRVSHRDWWDTVDSDASSLNEVWLEIVPSDGKLDI